jgi:hypothetical protein
MNDQERYEKYCNHCTNVWGTKPSSFAAWLQNTTGIPDFESDGGETEREVLLRVARRLGFPIDTDLGLTTRQISLWIASYDLTRFVVRDENGDRVTPSEEMFAVMKTVGETRKPKRSYASNGDGANFYSLVYSGPLERRESFAGAAQPPAEDVYDLPVEDSYDEQSDAECEEAND